MIKKSTQKKTQHQDQKDTDKREEPSDQTLEFLKNFARCCHIEKSVPAPLGRMCMN